MRSFKRFIGNWKVPMILVVALGLGIFNLPAEYQPGFVPESIQDMKINLGLDLQGGSQLDYKIDLSNVEEADQEQIVEGILEVINERVNRLGVSEPNIYLSNVADETHVIVELAGIDDLEEAKAQVGKTIQLEFKERNDVTELTAEEIAVVRENAESFLEEAKSSEDFTALAEEQVRVEGEKVYYDPYNDFTFAEMIPNEELVNVLNDLEEGEVYDGLIEGNFGLTFIGEIVDKQGFAVVKLNEKQEMENEKETPREVELDTILIQYEGADESASELSKDDAAVLASNLIGEIVNGERTFDQIGSEYIVNSELLEGSLELEEIKADLEAEGDIYDLAVETPYGYVLTRANAITEPSMETVVETAYRFEMLIYSTLPERWVATELDGSYFERADIAFQNNVIPVVLVKFNSEGAELFEELTERNLNSQIAIYVGGRQISAPNVSQVIAGGEATISGNFTIDSAQELARDLNTGAIPAPIELSGQYTIGPNLGQAALDASLKAGAVGLLLLAIYMIGYYRLAGVLANIALVVYSVLLIFLIKSSMPMWLALIFAFVIYCVALAKIYSSKEKLVEQTLSFVVATFALFFVSFLLSSPVVLTLAGVAGIILSVGMAVDANVLIFERIKEEIRDGRSYIKAVNNGFDKAWSSIRDSNFSSLITCGILYFFGSSIIRGFALNLAAGILISMFTAITVTKGMLVLLDKVDNKNLKLWFKADKNDSKVKTIDFLSKSKVWFAISCVLVVISVGAIATKGLNAGIDFTGGTFMEVQISDENVDKNLVMEKVVEAVGSEDVSVVTAGEGVYQIKTKYIQEETHDVILQYLNNSSESEVVENRFTTVGPTISESLKSKAVIALIVALVAIICYIAITFRNIPRGYSPWRFGLSAMVALTHDVIITLGVFSLFGLQVDALFITALLTVIGFSVHDTIVVFDRIRENLKGAKVKRGEFAKVCNLSLSQTLARSLNTSISTLLTLLSLLVLGSSSIFEFVLALVIGIGIGTYSSIFIASPALNKMQERKL